MADYTRCIAALNKAAGKELTADEVEEVFGRIQKTARDLAAGRRAFTDGPLPSTPDGLIRTAAELEAAELIKEKQRKLDNARRDVEVRANAQAQIDAMKAGGIDEVDAVRRLIVNDADGRANQFSLETRVKGVSAEIRRRVVDTWAAMDKSFLDYVQRVDKVKLLLEEIRGKDTGDATAKQGAKAWKDATEYARQWFNEKGGKIGHLEDWGLPQHHSQELVARAGRENWVSFVFDLLDRRRYTDLSGNPMSDAQVKALLNSAWDTVATNGASKIEPGQFRGAGGKANRHAEERQIHFRDADAMIEYWGRFGERTVPDILLGHLETMSRDIAFLEHFGTNPQATYKLMRDTAEKNAKLAAPTKADKIDKRLRSMDIVFDYAAGNTKPTVDRRISGFFDVMHNLNSAAKLGSAAWASLIGDKVMFEALSHLNNLPAIQRWRNEVRMLNPANAQERRLLRRQGLMLDYMSQAMYRFGDELGKSSLTGKLTNGVMRVTGMAAVNEWRRGAWALSAMDTLGHLVSTKDFGKVGSDDMRLLGSYGITEADWKVWKLAQLEDLGHGNDTGLTPEAVGRISDADLKAAGFEDPALARRDATVKLLGALTSESHLAVIEPGWQQRAMMYGGLQRGTMRDELTRSFWQFKAFPIAQFQNMIDLGMSRPTTGGKIAFLSILPVAMTLAGGMLLQVQELLAGRDPRPMNDWRFAAAAFMKGGSLGLYGDFMFSGGQTRMGTGPLEAVAGPTIGLAAELANLGAKAKQDIEKGETDKTAARAVSLAKGLIPGQNMWFSKAATDHIIFQNIQEALNPGYLQSMRARTEREYGNEWWWEPGEFTPDRPPDLGSALEDL